MLLHNVDGGPILRKLKHPAPPLDVLDSSFHFPFDEALHGDRLREQLDLSHLYPSIQLKVTNLIKEFWSVFDEHGVWVPVTNYKYVIDTGNAPPNRCEKDSVWAEGNSDYAEGHCCPQKGWAHSPDP